MEDLRKDIHDIRDKVEELVKQGAINTTVLIEHERRSLLLEERVKPLEEDFIFRSKLYTLAASVLALVSTAVAIYKLLH